MFKEITAISKNYAWVKIEGTTNEDLLNMNLVFEDNGKRILGEVDEVDDGKVKEFKGEVVFCDKNLSYDNVFAILKYILDYACNSYRVREVIRWLIDGDVTEEELISLEFDKDDIKKVKEDIEDEEN